MRCREHPEGPQSGLLALEWLNDFYTLLLCPQAFAFNEMPLRWQMAMTQISGIYHRYKLHSHAIF